jgi:hypothetical protein
MDKKGGRANTKHPSQPHMQTHAPRPVLFHRSVLFQQLGAKQGGLLILNLRKDVSKTRCPWHRTKSRQYLQKLKLKGIRTEQTLPALVLMSAFLALETAYLPCVPKTNSMI